MIIYQFYIFQAFPQVTATPAMIPVLQPMTSLSTTTQSQSEVTTQPLPTVTSTGETNPTKPTSKLTKAPPKTSMQYPLVGYIHRVIIYNIV